MNEEIEHTITLTIQEPYWPTISKALREARVMHRDNGGTSRMSKSKTLITFTARGPATAVLNTIDFVRKIEATCAASRNKTIDKLMDSLKPNPEREEARKREFMGMVVDNLARRKK